MGKNLIQKFSMGAGGAGVTEQLSQEGGMLLGRKERDPIETAIATGAGGAAELVMPAVQAVRGARQTKLIGEGS